MEALSGDEYGVRGGLRFIDTATSHDLIEGDDDAFDAGRAEKVAYDVRALFAQMLINNPRDRAVDLTTVAESILREYVRTQADGGGEGVESVLEDNVDAFERNLQLLMRHLEAASDSEDFVTEMAILIHLRTYQHGLQAMGVPLALFPPSLWSFVRERDDLCRAGLETHLSRRARPGAVGDLPFSSGVLSMVEGMCAMLQHLRIRHDDGEEDGAGHELQELMSDITHTMDASARATLVREVCRHWGHLPSHAGPAWLHALYNDIVRDTAIVCAVMSQRRAEILLAHREEALMLHRRRAEASAAGSGARLEGGSRVRHLGMIVA